MIFIKVESYEVIDYDGQNWEAFYGKSDISKFSKEELSS
jgi:hypothetical protein